MERAAQVDFNTSRDSSTGAICQARKSRRAFCKTPVNKRIPLHPLNLEGDKQADLSVHGGRDKTVYAYPSEHYPYWKKNCREWICPWGALGENFTTAGLVEDTVCLGDRFTIGTAGSWW